MNRISEWETIWALPPMSFSSPEKSCLLWEFGCQLMVLLFFLPWDALP